MRKTAQQLIDEYLREGRLAANRSQPIGAGAYGTVYSSDRPGHVMKQASYADTHGDIEREANLQAIGAEIGVAPQVAGLETFPAGVGNRIEMADARINHQPVDELSRQMQLQTTQQLGQLALKGVRLEDRRPANVMQHSMTGRPLQLDFGISGRVEGSERAATLANATAEGFEAAGIPDMGAILRATVMDYLEGGQVDEAMDIARQGFSRLQKIKSPLAKSVDLLDGKRV